MLSVAPSSLCPRAALASSGRCQQILQCFDGFGRVIASAQLERRGARDTLAEHRPSGLIGRVGLARLQSCQKLGTTKRRHEGAVAGGCAPDEYDADDLERPRREAKLGAAQVDL